MLVATTGDHRKYIRSKFAPDRSCSGRIIVAGEISSFPSSAIFSGLVEINDLLIQAPLVASILRALFAVVLIGPFSHNPFGHRRLSTPQNRISVSRRNPRRQISWHLAFDQYGVLRHSGVLSPG